MESFSTKGTKISAENGFRNAMLGFLKDLLSKGFFDGIFVPIKVPAGDSYAWVLIQDKSVLDDANPIAPVMPVQGAKALKSLTRRGKGNLRIAAIMRPCEIRASIELSKLNQVNLENITLVSYDCPGALPLSDYIENPKEGEKSFDFSFSGEVWDDEATKPVCQMCDHFSLPACDLHFGLLVSEEKSIFLISNSEKGKRVFDEMKMDCSEDLSNWESKVAEIKKRKEKKKAETFKEIQPMVEGFDNLLDTFANCIGCHNCQSVCPICYCRQCYFDSEVSKPTSDFILLKAEKRGGLSFPLDKIMFHTGRMSHMSLSCVSCGLCTDACPVSIPVAKIFSYVADKTQRAFEYKAGENAGEALPMREFKLDEIQGIRELVDSAEG